MKTISFLIFSVLLLVSGCASVPMQSAEADARAKQFSVPAGKANIYVYRNETMGGAIAMPISVNGKIAGRSAPNTYFLWTVNPGKYEIQSLTENVASITINAVKGKNHFVWQEVKMGMMSAGSALHEVSESEGRNGVLECGLAISNLQ